jgi:hypothetical protein
MYEHQSSPESDFFDTRRPAARRPVLQRLRNWWGRGR